MCVLLAATVLRRWEASVVIRIWSRIVVAASQIGWGAVKFLAFDAKNAVLTASAKCRRRFLVNCGGMNSIPNNGNKTSMHVGFRSRSLGGK